MEKRADKALDLVQMCELSAARHALKGDPHRARESPNVVCGARSREAPTCSEGSPDASVINDVPQVEIDLEQDKSWRICCQHVAGKPEARQA